jgi:hypothetical protein
MTEFDPRPQEVVAQAPHEGKQQTRKKSLRSRVKEFSDAHPVVSRAIEIGAVLAAIKIAQRYGRESGKPESHITQPPVNEYPERSLTKWLGSHDNESGEGYVRDMVPLVGRVPVIGRVLAKWADAGTRDHVDHHLKYDLPNPKRKQSIRKINEVKALAVPLKKHPLRFGAAAIAKFQLNRLNNKKISNPYSLMTKNYIYYFYGQSAACSFRAGKFHFLPPCHPYYLPSFPQKSLAS